MRCQQDKLLTPCMILLALSVASTFTACSGSQLNLPECPPDQTLVMTGERSGYCLPRDGDRLTAEQHAQNVRPSVMIGLRITLTNVENVPITVYLKQGQLFTQKDEDTPKYQVASLVHDYELLVPACSTRVYYVEGYCVNPDLAIPVNQVYEFTEYEFTPELVKHLQGLDADERQDALWRIDMLKPPAQQ